MTGTHPVPLWSFGLHLLRPVGTSEDVPTPQPLTHFKLRNGRRAILSERPRQRSEPAMFGRVVTLQGDSVVVAEACFVLSDGASCAELALAVAPAWRRQGIGSVLLESVCRAVRDMGIHQVDCRVPALLRSAIELFERGGFDLRPDPADPALMRARRELPPRLVSRQAPAMASPLGPMAGWLRPTRGACNFR